VPIVVFHIALAKAWTLNSWDRFMVPKPFSRAVLVTSRFMHVSDDADSAAHERLQVEMQAALDRVRVAAEAELQQRTRSR
jgi:hypothetical protein